MDGQRRRSIRHHDKEKDLNHSRARNSQRERHRRRKRPSNDRIDQTYTQATNNTSTTSRHREIPGYFYDSVKNRYFRVNKDQPERAVAQNQVTAIPIVPKDDSTSKSVCPSRLHHIRRRELFTTPCGGVSFKRNGLEQWARQLVNKKCISWSEAQPCPGFKGPISNLALSSNGERMATVTNLSGLGCNTIHVYDVKYDREEFINPKMFATIISSQVSNVEWNPNANMENFFLLNLLGSEDSKGSGVICKFNESTQSCELNSYPFPYGTAWHSTWCQNPQYSHLVGISGSKQAVLVDFQKKTQLCKIVSPSDMFCVEFAHRRPVVYLGCRNGNIMCVDIRMKNRRQNKPSSIGTKQHSSMTRLKEMHDENYLMASNFDGMIKMWDIRLSKPVKEYCGNVNEARIIPFFMDSTQTIMASAGQDGKTRIWSIGSCELLNIIDHPEVTSDCLIVPPLCLGEMWGNKRGMMGFAVGIEDKLHLYY